MNQINTNKSLKNCLRFAFSCSLLISVLGSPNGIVNAGYRGCADEYGRRKCTQILLITMPCFVESQIPMKDSIEIFGGFVPAVMKMIDHQLTESGTPRKYASNIYEEPGMREAIKRNTMKNCPNIQAYIPEILIAYEQINRKGQGIQQRLTYEIFTDDFLLMTHMNETVSDEFLRENGRATIKEVREFRQYYCSSIIGRGSIDDPDMHSYCQKRYGSN